MQGFDHRRYARFEVMECAIVIPGDGRPEFRAVVVDVSLGGVQLKSKDELPTGDLCELRIGRDGVPPIVIKGEVRYSNQIEGSELFASGYRFLPETHEQRVAVALFVHEAFRRQGERLAEALPLAS